VQKSVLPMTLLTLVGSVFQCANVFVISGNGVGPFIITSAALLVRCMIEKLQQKKWKIKCHRILMSLDVFGLLCIILISSITNDALSKNLLRVIQIIIYILTYIEMFEIGQKIEDEDYIYRFVRSLTIFLIVIGFIQLGVTSNIIPRIGIMKTLIYNDTTSDVIYFTRNHYYRILSTYMEPSYYSGFIVGAFYYFLFYKARRQQSIWILVLAIVQILLTRSATAYGAFAVAGLIFIAINREGKLKVFLILAAVFGFAVFYVSFYSILEDVILNKMASGSGVARNGWNLIAIRNFNSSKLIGIGYKQSRASSVIYTILGELGIIGMSFWAIVNVRIIRPIFSRKNQRREESHITALRFAVLSVLLTMIIAVPDIDICTYWMWMFLLALSIGIKERQSRLVVKSNE